MNMKRLVKFLHELGSVGFTGAIVVMLVLQSMTPEPTELEAYALLRGAIAKVSASLLFPSLGIVLVSGLLAMAATRAYRDVGWVWLKLLLGVSVFEGTLVAIHGPAVRAAELAEEALAGAVDIAQLGKGHDESMALTVMLCVALINIWLAVYRPRFGKRSVGVRPTEAVQAQGAAEAPAEAGAETGRYGGGAGRFSGGPGRWS